MIDERRGWILVIGFCLILIGCRNPQVVSENLQVQFEAMNQSPFDQSQQVQVLPSETGFELEGIIRTPDPCQKLHGEAQVDESELQLRVIARSVEDGACAQVISYFRYRFHITNLPENTTTFSLQHEYENTGWSSSTLVKGRPLQP